MLFSCLDWLVPCYTSNLTEWISWPMFPAFHASLIVTASLQIGQWYLLSLVWFERSHCLHNGWWNLDIQAKFIPVLLWMVLAADMLTETTISIVVALAHFGEEFSQSVVVKNIKDGLWSELSRPYLIVVVVMVSVSWFVLMFFVKKLYTEFGCVGVFSRNDTILTSTIVGLSSTPSVPTHAWRVSLSTPARRVYTD